MSGSGQRFVGFRVGKYCVPDIDRTRRINSLGHNCRECRVFIREEPPGESGLLRFDSIRSASSAIQTLLTRS